MIPHWLERTELLVGPEALERVLGAHVLVVGLGGVGSFAAEFLARAGVGRLTIVDGDVVDPTNRNRQLQALSSTHGQKKAWLIRDRIRDINPECEVVAIDTFLDPEAMRALLRSAQVDFALDCIDSVQPKDPHRLRGHFLLDALQAVGKMVPHPLRFPGPFQLIV